MAPSTARYCCDRSRMNNEADAVRIPRLVTSSDRRIRIILAVICPFWLCCAHVRWSVVLSSEKHSLPTLLTNAGELGAHLDEKIGLL